MNPSSFKTKSSLSQTFIFRVFEDEKTNLIRVSKHNINPQGTYILLSHVYQLI